MTGMSLLLIDKSGTPKMASVKDFKIDELYKKCGFKKPDGLEKRHAWVLKCDKTNYRISVYAKDDGKANMENKFEFPPPIDTALYFGTCAVLIESKNSSGEYVPASNVSLELWDKLYEKMFGGFETLSGTCKDDDAELDELDNVIKTKKTSTGYLKDGFVVDSDNEEDSDEFTDVDSDEEEVHDNDDCDEDGKLELLELEDVGSELSEESYTYSK
jgi:hypothetical protein